MMEPERPITLNVVIPVYNEEHVLAASVSALREFLEQNLSAYAWHITVADNASTDGTLRLAEELAAAHPDVRVKHLPEKGRGRALRRAWLEDDADVQSYMDVDLSTDLRFFPALVDAIARDRRDVAIGSRLMRGARTTRSFKRELISRCYNLLIKALFLTRFSDAQCGFKAISREAASELIPRVKNQKWFLDTELLILAEKKGYSVREIPVVWREDPDTRVKIGSTAMEDIAGLLRLRFGGLPGPRRPRRSR